MVHFAVAKKTRSVTRHASLRQGYQGHGKDKIKFGQERNLVACRINSSLPVRFVMKLLDVSQRGTNDPLQENVLLQYCHIRYRPIIILALLWGIGSDASRSNPTSFRLFASVYHIVKSEFHEFQVLWY